MMDSTADRHCTAQWRDGSFCGSPSHPDAPFPICARHARQAYEFGVNLIAVSTYPSGAPKLDVAIRAFDRPRRQLTARDKAVLLKASPTDPGVYFLALGGLIKIGASSIVQKRIKTYPPSSELLAIQWSAHPFDLEKEMHSRFAHLRASGREWFMPAPDLLAHIESLNS